MTTPLGDLDRRLLADRHTRYGWLYGRARSALILLAQETNPYDPVSYAAAVLGDLQAAEAVELDDEPEEGR